MYNITDYKQFDDENYYSGELGVKIVEDHTYFKTWSPLATGVYIKIFADGDGNNLIEILPLERGESGSWHIEFLRNLSGTFYTYIYEFDYSKRFESGDLYAVACGINGKRSAIIDMSKTNPFGWDYTKRVVCNSPCDAVIYECHIRDFSIDESGGIMLKYRGKFLGMAENGLTNNGICVGLSHLRELGITHVQLLPIYDFASIDEEKAHSSQYNWGYDPLNYNCPEGSYSTDPYNPSTRVFELKTLIMELHKLHIGVIMDVVYNHSFFSDCSWFQHTFPNYYYRLKNGSFSNGSGVGNEVASEHAMVRRYIKDSVKFWAKEYKLDGFRFDLMAVLDIDTINQIRDELNEIDPDILMYGEGWSGGECAYDSNLLGYKWNNQKFERIGLFNDTIRDAVKGGTFDVYTKGYVNGNYELASIVKHGLVGSVSHHQLEGNDYAAWASSPTQSINYCEAHDNWTLWDKLCVSAEEYTAEQRISMDKLAAAIIILSQGVPFLHLGQDFLRSKPRTPAETAQMQLIHEKYNENSYNAPDFTNSIKWNHKLENLAVFKYYKALIRLRRAEKLFRLRNADDIRKYISFLHAEDDKMIYMKLENSMHCYVVAINPYTEPKWIDLPDGQFYIRLSENAKTFHFPLQSNHISIPPISAIIFKRYSNNESAECSIR